MMSVSHDGESCRHGVTLSPCGACAQKDERLAAMATRLAEFAAYGKRLQARVTELEAALARRGTPIM